MMRVAIQNAHSVAGVEFVTKTGPEEGEASHSLYRAWAHRYDRLTHFLRYAQTRQAILRNFLPALPQRASILDVGCGTGICTETLVRTYSGSCICGLDGSEEMLSVFRQRYPAIPTLLDNFNRPNLIGTHPMLQPGSYDLIVSSGALSEYGHSQAYQLVAGLLKEQGIFLNIGIRCNALGRLIGAMWGFRPSSPGEIIAACRKVGLWALAYPLKWNQFPRTLIDVVIRAEKRSLCREIV